MNCRKHQSSFSLGGTFRTIQINQLQIEKIAETIVIAVSSAKENVSPIELAIHEECKVILRKEILQKGLPSWYGSNQKV